MGVKASIVVRVKDEATGKRRWVKANGKSDPQGSYYLRYCEGRSPRYQHAGDRYDVAFAEKIKLERRLKVAELGGVLPEELVATVTVAAPANRHRILDICEEHIAEQSKPDKNGDVRPAKSMRCIRYEVGAFVKWSGRMYVDELSRETMIGYRDWLATVGKNGKPYQPDTIVNKLMTILTTLKNNSLCPTKPFLPASQFPDKKDTIPDPYTHTEYDSYMEHASYEDALLFGTLISSGLRDQELAHAEKRDIDWDLGVLHIVKKRDMGFLGKTPAARRAVPLPADLLAEFALRPEGLLLPAPEGGVAHDYLDRIEAVAKRAGILGTTQKAHMVAAGMVRDDWTHRCRDTAITLGLHRAANMAETMQLCQRIGHIGTGTLPKYFGKLKVIYEPNCRCAIAVPKYIQRIGKRKDIMLLKLKQVAAELGVALITVRRWCRAGTLRCVRMGRQVRVDSDDLLAFIEQRKT